MTDANLVLGYLNEDSLAGGALGIRRDLAETAILRHISGTTRLSLLEAAYGIHQVANSNLVRAIKSVSTERGRDPREFALFAFGGNSATTAGTGLDLGDRGDLDELVSNFNEVLGDIDLESAAQPASQACSAVFGLSPGPHGRSGKKSAGMSSTTVSMTTQ